MEWNREKNGLILCYIFQGKHIFDLYVTLMCLCVSIVFLTPSVRIVQLKPN